ncbi:hypothetical protein [Terrarubrum flagellatum]|uniref:hypothetical protein n=1 Tax=Terrirubrum flagellatum TaxID=2895980 RepID=UPI0031454CE4
MKAAGDGGFFILNEAIIYEAVMPALVAGIHVFLSTENKTWMAGTSPAMTEEYFMTPVRLM